MPSDYINDLVDHKRRVSGYLLLFANELSKRAAVHDNSKFEPEEFELYEAAFPELQKYAYGSVEFKRQLEEIRPAIQHHYKTNDHHPEHFECGINDMHLVQIIEMICDWLAAGERSQTSIADGLEMNRRRFHIFEQLFNIIENTAEYLKKKNTNE